VSSPSQYEIILILFSLSYRVVYWQWVVQRLESFLLIMKMGMISFLLFQSKQTAERILLEKLRV